MSHMGDPNVQTPHMDRMAEEGASFRRAYANCPICTPSRGTIFSGRHAHAGPVQSFFDVFKASAPSTATILRSAGYHTAYFGKWHCGIVLDQLATTDGVDWDPYGGPNRTPEYHRAGFQDWYAFEYNNDQFKGRYYHQDEVTPRKLDGYQADVLTDMTLEYLENYQRDEPLFLVLSVEPPHFPLEVPDSYKRFDPASLEVRPNFHDTPEMREKLTTYYAMVENLDRNIGRVLDKLQSLPAFRDDTLTVYFSDHGDHMGSHGLIERKEHIHEEASRIPAIFHCPGKIPAQGSIDGLFSLVDMMVTTLGLSGIDVPAHNQGTDFSPTLRGESFSGPSEILAEMSGAPRWNLDFVDWRGLITERWKYAYYETGHELLFDLEEDPYELKNMAAERPDIREAMKDRLLALLAESREPYFDVLIRDGVKPERPSKNVARKWKSGVFPGWDDLIENVDP